MSQQTQYVIVKGGRVWHEVEPYDSADTKARVILSCGRGSYAYDPYDIQREGGAAIGERIERGDEPFCKGCATLTRKGKDDGR